MNKSTYFVKNTAGKALVGLSCLAAIYLSGEDWMSRGLWFPYLIAFAVIALLFGFRKISGYKTAVLMVPVLILSFLGAPIYMFSSSLNPFLRCSVLCSFPFLMAVILSSLSETKEGEKRFLDSKFFLWGCLALSLFFIQREVLVRWNEALELDEHFSFHLAVRDWGEMFRLAALDVHPPFYYIILKLAMLGGSVICPSAQNVIFAKFVSVIPILVFICITCTKVRKDWGNYAAGVLLLSVHMPPFVKYITLMRMYSWVICCLFCAYLLVREIILYNRRRDWCLFMICGIVAAYLHYYACIAIATLYVFLLFYAIRRPNEMLARWLGISVVTTLSYIPWLWVLLSQLHTIETTDYWLKAMTWIDYIKCIRYIFPNFLLISVVPILTVLAWKKSCSSCSSDLKAYLLCGGCVLLFVSLVGLTVSYFVCPVFEARSLLGGLICFWMMVIFSVSRCRMYRVRFIVALIILVSSFVAVKELADKNVMAAYELDTQRTFANQYADATFVCAGELDQCVMTNDLKKDFYLLARPCPNEMDIVRLVDVGNNFYTHDVDTLESFQELMKRSKEVIYVESWCGKMYNPLPKWGFKCEYLGSSKTVTFYRVTPQQ